MAFINQMAFDEPGLALLASGKAERRRHVVEESGRRFVATVQPNAAIVGPYGEIIGYSTSGGIAAPAPFPVDKNRTIVRFGSGPLPQDVEAGEWWLEADEFSKVSDFAAKRGIGVTAALRLLCAVPPEWSSCAMMVIATVIAPLLALRGFGNSAILPAPAGSKEIVGKTESGILGADGRPVGETHGGRPATIAHPPQYARSTYIPILIDASGQRIAQLFIPGLAGRDLRRDCLVFGPPKFFSREESMRGYNPVLV